MAEIRTTAAPGRRRRRPGVCICAARAGEPHSRRRPAKKRKIRFL